MALKYLPWKFLVQRASRRMRFIDPVDLLAKLRRFSRPSKIQEPIELIRAGIQFHARGLINTKAIQHNLDWVWPMWVERQFSPKDSSFIPRAFSFSHVNLTHRNWTGLGLPDFPVTPIVDPNGLITPLYDGWSLEWMLIDTNNQLVCPSKLTEVEQRMDFEHGHRVITKVRKDGMLLESTAEVVLRDGNEVCTLSAKATGDNVKGIILSLRPYNPEGIQFIDSISLSGDQSLFVNKTQRIDCLQKPQKVALSDYDKGDVLLQINDPASDRNEISCKAGMATAALVFQPDEAIRADIPLEREAKKVEHIDQQAKTLSWADALQGTAKLEIPDPQKQFLYDNALRSLILLSPDEIVPGPYTYKRFWFRDACLMANAMLGANLPSRVERCLPEFIKRQKNNGYFHSQEGEWDSNGQVLWLLEKYFRSTNKTPDGKTWRKSIEKAADWICQHRTGEGARNDGLFPAGFSAEHLGPVDHYYWDNFWGAAGLQSASWLMTTFDEPDKAKTFAQESKTFFSDIEKSLHKSNRNGAMPAASERRMDAGAIGSLVADYPLQLLSAEDERLQATLEWIREHCLVDDGFFQDMIHSGINAYLTLDIAQSYLRQGNDFYRTLIDAIAAMATDTGNWPEAIHPLTKGGCMGDGHHGWAAAEWVMMMRSLFVREEGEQLVLFSGIYPEWLTAGARLSFGPTLTEHGQVTLTLEVTEETYVINIAGDWHTDAPEMRVAIPGQEAFTTKEETVTVKK